MPETQTVGSVQAFKAERKQRGTKVDRNDLGEHKPYVIIELDRVQAPNGEIANAASIEYGGGLTESADLIVADTYGSAPTSPREDVSDADYAEFLHLHTEYDLIATLLEQTAAVIRETQNIPKR